MPRLLFEKTGNAVWISHLDLMRLFQRAFKRAGLPLTHTQGFNPRPSVSIALPLSVGVESHCELLDFDLDDCDVPVNEIPQKLNKALIPGVRVLDAYDGGRKIRELSLLRCCVTLEYDTDVPRGAEEAIRCLFEGEELIVPKRTKNGIQDQNIIPMIRTVDVCKTEPGILQLHALICCQNPSLNPLQLSQAICIYLPQMKPAFSECCRMEIYDCNEKFFR